MPGRTHSLQLPRLHLPAVPSDPPSRLLWAAVGACAASAVATGVYYATKTFEQYVPLQYQYRPGTISGWLAHMLSTYSKRRRNQRPVRVYMDGCFDMMHYGHANALRQAKAMGDVLVVGLVPDSEILRCKGPPVLNDDERLALVESVKWVDEVITGVPYDLSPTFIQDLFAKHRIDYIIHGDDPCLLPDGSDAYAHAKKLGRFRMIKRTEGVSTTDIVGRMLTCTRVNPYISGAEPHPLAKCFSGGDAEVLPAPAASASTSSGQPHGQDMNQSATRTALSKFLPTSRRLVQFSNGRIAPEGARIVYIDGAFDVFHPGHVRILKAAKACGDFLLVGLHTDEDVQDRRGPYLPIMNLHERSLSVLACKYVDEVVIGSPTILAEDLITTFNISLVVRGTVSETGPHSDEALQGQQGQGTGAGEAQGQGQGARWHAESDGGGIQGAGAAAASDETRYAAAMSAGIFHRLQSPSQATARNIIQRIVAKRQEFEARNAKKVKSEVAYYTDKKEYVAEL